MTNEEHIEQLKKLRSFHNGSYGRSINKAIESLNQKSNLGVDCISREQALEPYKILEDTDTLSVYTIRQNLAELPSITPQEPKIGHWIQTNEFFINQDGRFIYEFVCSECKSLSYFRKSNKKAIGANVCPNCGADMREGEA